ncbi:hypothetical protein FRB90_010171 [Tulasnella sp. 427]|nr:hypothetical protein FRB90_010171 [Tulasnella sp. 427]
MDSIRCTQKALTMAKNTPLDIKHVENRSDMVYGAFLKEISARTAQWRSYLTQTSDPAFLFVLSKAATPKLETLSLYSPWHGRWNRGTSGTITLFEGAPAPLTLKDFRVDYIPVAVGPLHLTGLRTLELTQGPLISAAEVLRIVENSPALEKLILHSLSSLKDEVVPENDRELTVFARADRPTIQLPQLNMLILRNLSVSFNHLIISNIHTPKLQSLALDCMINRPDQSPASSLFTEKVRHLLPTLEKLISKVDDVDVIALSETDWTIRVGTIHIGLLGRCLKRVHMAQTLDWLGDRVRAQPVTLSFDEFETDSGQFAWLADTFRVTKLNLWTASFPPPTPNTPGGSPQPRRRIISLLSKPFGTDTTRWLCPELEKIDTNVIDESGKSAILEMVRGRHSFIEEQVKGEMEGAYSGVNPFKELKLRGGRYGVSQDMYDNLEFLTALGEAGRDADIWWEADLWCGPPNPNAVYS